MRGLTASHWLQQGDFSDASAGPGALVQELRHFRGGGHSSHIARKPGSSGSSLCVRACMRAPFHSCTPLVVDTIWERDATLPEIVAVDVTAAEHCNWRLTVLNETSSDGHKVKLLGFMIAESDRVRAWGAAAENLG